MLLLSSICNGQGRTTFGASRAQDTSLTVAQVKFSAYGGSLDTMLMIILPNGDVKKVAKNHFGGSDDTWQDVLSRGDTALINVYMVDSSSLIIDKDGLINQDHIVLRGGGYTNIMYTNNQNKTFTLGIGGSGGSASLTDKFFLYDYQQNKAIFTADEFGNFNVGNLADVTPTFRVSDLYTTNFRRAYYANLLQGAASDSVLVYNGSTDGVQRQAPYNTKINYSDTLTSIATKTNITAPAGAIVFGSGVGLTYDNLKLRFSSGRWMLGTATPLTWGIGGAAITATASIVGQLYARSDTSEHFLENTFNTSLGGGTINNANVLKIKHRSPTGSSAIRFVQRNDNEGGAVGYQNGTGAFYLDNSAFLSANIYDSTGTIITGAKPPNLILGQEGWGNGAFRRIARFMADTVGYMAFRDWMGVKQFDLPAAGGFNFYNSSGTAIFTGDAAGGWTTTGATNAASTWAYKNTLTTGNGDITLQLHTYNGTAVAFCGGLGSTNSTYSFQDYRANSTHLVGARANGLALMANHASGIIRFYTAGDALANLRGVIDSVGVFNWGQARTFKITQGGAITRYQGTAIGNGQVLLGNGTTGEFDKGTLTAGNGITITNAPSQITIANNGTGDGAVTVTSAAILTFTTSGNYVFTGGSLATWTLPAVSGTTGRTYFIKNRGSGNVNINAAASANEIYSNSAVNTYALTPGSAIILVSDGSFFLVE